MKISTFHEHILEAAEQRKESVTTLFQEIHKKGIDGLEIDLDRLLPIEVQGKTVLEQLEQAGLKISCIYGFYDMAHKDETERIRSHIAMAKLGGAERVMPIPGFFSEEEYAELKKIPKDYESLCEFYDQNASVQKHIAGLKQFIRMAKEEYPQLKVTLEDFDSYNSPIATIGGLRYYLEHVEGLYYTLDCGNLAYSDENILEAMDVLGKYIAHVHCKDRGEEPERPEMNGLYRKGLLPIPVGKGYIPFDIILDGLKKMNYEGYYAIEHFGAEDQLQYLYESLDYLKKSQ